MFLQLAFNTAKHESTRATPFEVMFPIRAGSPLLHNWGIQDLLPDNCTKASIQRRWADVRKSLIQSHQPVAHHYNKGRTPQSFKVGDMVFLKKNPLSDASRKIAGKLCPRWRGPFKVQSFLTPVTAKLVNSTTGEYVTRAHLSQMKPADVN
jgi:hypothetical protein